MCPKVKDKPALDEFAPEVEVPTGGSPQRETIQQVMTKASYSMAQAQVRRKELYQKYKNEAKVPMYLSPMYQPYFGKVMRVSINGITIFFKVDGKAQLIPKTFADEITSRRMRIDTMLTKQGRMARVTENFEKSPGELKLF